MGGKNRDETPAVTPLVTIKKGVKNPSFRSHRNGFGSMENTRPSGPTWHVRGWSVKTPAPEPSNGGTTVGSDDDVDDGHR